MESNYKVPNKLKYLKAFYSVFSEKSVSEKKCREQLLNILCLIIKALVIEIKLEHCAL